MKRSYLKKLDTQQNDYQTKSKKLTSKTSKNRYMKKTSLILFLMGIFMIGCKTQTNLNKVVYSEKTKQDILIGKINKDAFDKKPFKKWFVEEYNNYTPNQKDIEYLKSNVQESVKFIIVLGTWCPDSRREIPRFFKILDEINFDYSKVQIYAVDKDFKLENQDISKLKIKRVPTIIYHHHGYEAGRIIETPKVSLEADFVDFTNRK